MNRLITGLPDLAKLRDGRVGVELHEKQTSELLAEAYEHTAREPGAGTRATILAWRQRAAHESVVIQCPSRASAVRYPDAALAL